MRASFSTDHSINATSLLNIDKALDKCGLDPKRELKTLGFQPSDFNGGELRLPLRLVAEILQHCIHITNCDHFVLELVRMQTSAIDSYFGMLLRTSATLGDALRLAARELYIHSKGVTWAFLHEEKHACFSLSLDTENLETNHRYPLAELGIAQAWLIMSTQCQQPVRLETVQFVRDTPTDQRPYRHFFNAPVWFNSDTDLLSFDAKQLNIPMSHADPHLHGAIHELVKLRRANASSKTLAEEVCAIIRVLLPQGTCSIDQVASYLMRDKRTLQRQLRDEFDINFRSLRQAERMRLAQTYLQESRKSIIQIAYATGYKEPTNMARAFRKQFDCTPQQWRKRYTLNYE